MNEAKINQNFDALVAWLYYARSNDTKKVNFKSERGRRFLVDNRKTL